LGLASPALADDSAKLPGVWKMGHVRQAGVDS
jgi:hypothetical protein